MAKNLLVTAFKPYQNYFCNVSERALCAMAERRRTAAGDESGGFVFAGSPRDLRSALYDVDFDAIGANLEADLTPEIGAAILMGQAPGRATIDLERFAINAGIRPGSDEWFPLEPGGPEALKSDLPLDNWARRLKEQGFPARQSFHAGTYLCNASLYGALRNFQRQGRSRAAVFLHLPLAREHYPDAEIALPMETILRAVDATIDLAIEWIEEQEQRNAATLV